MSSEDTDESQKTEEPTGKKLADAREKGDVPKSQEMNSWFSFFGFMIVVSFFTVWIAQGMGQSLTVFLERPDLIRLESGHVSETVKDMLLEIGALFAIPAVIFIFFAIASGLIQHGWLISYESLKPKFNKISLLAGFKRLFSIQSVMNLVKGLAKLIIVGSIIGLVIWPKRSMVPQLAELDVSQMAMILLDWTKLVLVAVVAVMAIIAGLDFLFQYFQYIKKLKMSKQEIKDEMKQSEGDPAVKGRLRQLRMEKARQRMMAAVPSSDVVITNPTHFAVALEYKGETMEAPRLVAKGVDAVAFRIRKVAEENKVTVVENPPLARALYAGVEIDQEIPPEHYKAVAEVIGYVLKLKGKMK
ncbi:flagellar biosynthesis protein FlhB [Kiloniella laminariae]|uniref:Flagellar biosynthetic protein FlhB n=1 Tax=Kiloniella laminariae TaxID=454162 RepID=A0ABT4LH91_9PROT|nr:flagellar biosynthesis protein FlhB [Kiloniella laminariae]MCZ4280472.1 flagellar biosynthesis protein FlhB [Kiloniella laminariae]